MPARYLLSPSGATAVRGLVSQRGGIAFDDRLIAPPASVPGETFVAVVTGRDANGVYTARAYYDGAGGSNTGNVRFVPTEFSPQATIPNGSVVLLHAALYVGAEDGNEPAGGEDGNEPAEE